LNNQQRLVVNNYVLFSFCSFYVLFISFSTENTKQVIVTQNWVEFFVHRSAISLKYEYFYFFEVSEIFQRRKKNQWHLFFALTPVSGYLDGWTAGWTAGL
jgi:hypothetical protein